MTPAFWTDSVSSHTKAGLVEQEIWNNGKLMWSKCSAGSLISSSWSRGGTPSPCEDLSSIGKDMVDTGQDSLVDSESDVIC